MTRKSRFIPFSLKPSTWSMDSKEKERARAEYHLEGEELDRALIEINYRAPLSPIEEKQCKLAKLAVDRKYNRISAIDYDKAVAEVEYPIRKSPEYKQKLLEIKFNHDELNEYEYDLGLIALNHKDKQSQEYLIAFANIELKHGNINELDYGKAVANAKREPWVTVLESNVIYGSEGSQLSFELDWNSYFVADLRRHGWTGLGDQEVVDQWFTHMCQDMFATEEDYLPDEAGPATITRRDTDGTKTEYS